MSDYKMDPNNPNKQIPNTTYLGGDGNVTWVSGSTIYSDGESIKDEGDDVRIVFTDGGALVLNDESGNAGITLNTDQTTTFAAGITLTTGDVSTTAGTLDVNDGGAITQTAGDRTNGVTLSKVTGQVTVDDDALAPVTIVKHVVTNTTVAATDVVLVSKVSGDADTSIWVDAVGSGQFTVALRNNAASGDDTTALVYNFVVIKGSSS